MRRHMTLTSAVGASLVLLLAAAPAAAGMETYKIDPVHSNVGFKIRHIISKVPGRFGGVSGTIELDPANLKTGKVRVEIDAASIDTGNEDRDNHLRSPDFFDVEKFPKITFESTEVVPKGENGATVKGNLTLHGVTKPVELDVEVLGFAKGMRGSHVGAFEARATINRTEFGVAWNRALEGGGAILGDEVEISLNIESVRQEPKPEAATSGR